jgi:hypothetical protein
MVSMIAAALGRPRARQVAIPSIIGPIAYNAKKDRAMTMTRPGGSGAGRGSVARTQLRGESARAGLLGLRERVDMFGGQPFAGPSAHGGWTVRALFPTPR